MSRPTVISDLRDRCHTKISDMLYAPQLGHTGKLHLKSWMSGRSYLIEVTNDHVKNIFKLSEDECRNWFRPSIADEDQEFSQIFCILDWLESMLHDFYLGEKHGTIELVCIYQGCQRFSFDIIRQPSYRTRLLFLHHAHAG